ncbi:MAG TPA: SMC-Scp complex subunit ScpB [Acidobacteriaceae bacterium]|jgi:segregation and condensation protein B|nr:SMC-Scp complex subunit ScpB [Acidobacteriaceae bacterium]
MSLKAKIEAVIYAAEEPVTLAQLTAVFEQEILASLPQEDSAEESVSPTNTDTGEAQHSDDPPTAEAAAEVADSSEQATLPITGMTPEDTKLARQRDKQVRAEVEQVVHALIAEYASDDRGMEIREIAGGYRMATKAEYHDAVRAFVKRLKPPMKLSLQALETLAVVAYKQPVTAPEISEIRGVDSGGVLGSLISRKLIATAGRKQVIGRPILYKTTKDFLLRFGLKDVNELPSIEEFEKMAAEMADAEAVDSSLQEYAELENAEPESIANPNPEADISNSEENATVTVTKFGTTEDPAHESEK